MSIFYQFKKTTLMVGLGFLAITTAWGGITIEIVQTEVPDSDQVGLFVWGTPDNLDENNLCLNNTSTHLLEANIRLKSPIIVGFNDDAKRDICFTVRGSSLTSDVMHNVHSNILVDSNDCSIQVFYEYADMVARATTACGYLGYCTDHKPYNDYAYNDSTGRSIGRAEAYVTNPDFKDTDAGKNFVAQCLPQ